jgi:hypothetical protein
MTKNATLASLVLAALAASAGSAFAQKKVTPPITSKGTVYVTSTADSGKASLREAIALATAGQTIELAFTVPATIALESTLVVARNVTIVARLPVTLTGAASGMRLLRVEAGSTVDVWNVSFGQAGTRHAGGAINNSGVLTLRGCDIRNFDADFGGAILNDHVLSLEDCSIVDNAAGVGGAIVSTGYVTAVRTLFARNAAALGAALQVKGTGAARLLNTAVVGGTGTSSHPSQSVVQMEEGAYLLLDHAAIAVNQATTSVHAPEGAAVVVRSSILSNTTGANFTGGARMESGGLNITFSAGGDVWQPAGVSDRPNTDPRVVVPPGGAFFLDVGSPAIDADDCVDAAGNVVADDIRGGRRPAGVTCDIGPFEVDAEVPDIKNPACEIDDLGTKIDLQKDQVALVKGTVDDTKIGVAEMKTKVDDVKTKVDDVKTKLDDVADKTWWWFAENKKDVTRVESKVDATFGALTTLVPTRASQESVDDVKGALAMLEASLKLDQAAARRLAIERALLDNDRLASLFLPGGIEQVRDVVKDVLSRSAAAGLPAAKAEQEYQRGLSALAAGDYKAAYDRFARAYEQLVK